MKRHDLVNIWSDDAALPERKLIYVGNPSDEIWTTKAGDKLTVGSMTDDHIKNCYRMVRPLDKYWSLVFEAELTKRGIKI